MSAYDPGYRSRVNPSLSVQPERLRVVPLAGRRRVRTETLTALLMMPRGAVTVFVGWQGIGKGTILSRVAADETQRGHGVGIVSDEDSLDATILPRLQAASADLAQVHTFEPIDPDDLGVLVPKDNAEIARAVEYYQMRLLILDPWTNHIDVPDVDKGQVRAALMPLARMCRDTDLTAVLSAHPNRRDTDDPLQSIAHASAVSQVARCVYHVVIDPTKSSTSPKENRHRLVIHGKANLTGYGDTLRYRLEQTLLPAQGDQPEVETVRAEYEGVEGAIPDYATARQRIRQLERRGRSEIDDATAEGRARQFLIDFLTSGPKPPDDVKMAGKAAGHAARTIERVRPDVADSVSVPGSQRREWQLRTEAVRHPNDAFADGEDGENGEKPHLTQERVLPARDLLAISPFSPSSHAGETWREEQAVARFDDEGFVW